MEMIDCLDMYKAPPIEFLGVKFVTSDNEYYLDPALYNGDLVFNESANIIEFSVKVTPSIKDFKLFIGSLLRMKDVAVEVCFSNYRDATMVYKGLSPYSIDVSIDGLTATVRIYCDKVEFSAKGLYSEPYIKSMI